MNETLQQTLAMGGYALYVWLAYGMTLLVFIANVVIPRKTYKKLLKKLRAQEKDGNNVT